MRCPRAIRLLALLAALLPGCFLAQKKKHDNPPPPTPEIPINAADVYTLGCPDVVEVTFQDWPDAGQTVRIEADGCVPLGRLGRVAVEGITTAEAARAIADRAEVSPRRVRVRVAGYNSRQVLLYGQVKGEPRVLDYRGPETVAELLQRAGGLSADAAPAEVHVVRAHVGEGIPTEVIHVDLVAIREKKDLRTNARVQPLDEVYVGEAARSRIGKAVPSILKPIYEGIVSFIPARKTPPPK